MQIMNIDFRELLKVVEECKGTVEIVTKQGDRLNLKSEICKYLILSDFFKDDRMKEVELLCSDPEDMAKIFGMLASGSLS